ncbi:MAG: phage shock protein operon transcriptional activator [Desulfotignum sp.]|nr:phage shock protein operon transcriptional activator [Desulfotignum sp.]
MVEYTTYEAIGQSEAFIAFQEQISRVAPVERPVMIIGERGVGKELAASRIHFLSTRWKKPLVTLNCAALTPTLIGSELFGYEKGAFTGAGNRMAGRFEQAAGGTLFLDEIGTIPMEVQEKILRAVEYGAFERVGSSRPVQVDVRIVTATNADLPVMAENGTFKRDLLDRLSFEVIHVPPLRCRQEDILLLARHFASRMAFELGWEQMPELTDTAENALISYPWPGNVRELKNVVERAVYKSATHQIVGICFDPFENPFRYSKREWKSTAPDPTRPETVEMPETVTDHPVAELMNLPLKTAVQILETLRVKDALKRTRFHQKRAAAQLGLTYDQFRGIKKRLGI